MNDEPHLELNDGAMRLFIIALKNDSDKLLTSNWALHRALRTAGELPSIDEVFATRLCQEFTFPGPAIDLFSFAAATLEQIESERFDPLPGNVLRERKRSDWDHAALLALGQTICRAGVLRKASNPEIALAVSHWSTRDPLDLQIDLLGHYFGNILQDYFEACEVRRQVRDLPDDIENQLWSADAKAMAQWVRSVAAPGDEVLSWGATRDAIDKLARKVFLMDAGRE